MSGLYDTDVYTWAMKQADALRRRSANEVDWDNVAEEIESVGKGELRELRSRYLVLLTHLLKWLYQPENRGASWQTTIAIQRLDAADVLAENPGLKPLRDEAFAFAYRRARLEAAKETGLPLETFSETNPFTLAQAMDEDFFPQM
jgi:cobyrinic acid a,c-diamide synthase